MLAASRLARRSESIANPSIYSKTYTEGSDPFSPMVCLDMEGVLGLENWIAVADDVGGSDSKRMTRDELERS